MVTMAAVNEFVGGAEIGRMLGVSRQRVTQLTGLPTFPAPVVVLAMGKVWRTSEVIAWAEARGREIKER
jgi:prophage regulatory protein